MRELLERVAGPALVLGGLLWVLTYLVEIAIGVVHGEDVYLSGDLQGYVLMWLWPAFFFSAQFLLGGGLVGLATRVRGRGKVLAAVGAVLAVMAVVASSVNLALLTGVRGEPTASDDLGFLGVIGVLLGSALVGGAAVRAAILPRWARTTLALMPLIFVPAILATFPLEAVAPLSVAADFPFALVGLVFAAIGRALLRQATASAPTAAPAIV